MVVVVAACVAFAVIIAILSPFWLGRGGPLESCAAMTRPEQAEAAKDLVVEQFKQGEKALADGLISSYEWERRRRFLEGRYLDAARRLDFLRAEADV